jgi:hypothetical protein
MVSGGFPAISSSDELARAIADQQARDANPVVERAILGTADPAAIAAQVASFCRAQLGTTIALLRFYWVSVGCVLGLDLEDGRSIVVKVQNGARDGRYLAACLDVRRELVAAGFPCPRPIAGPIRLGPAWATVEELDDRGTRADAHDPAVRRELARVLAQLVDVAKPFASSPAFGGAWFTSLPNTQIFPRTHSPLFDFSATASGAEWIEDLAARARSRSNHAKGEKVLGHFDWRIEHVRFDDGRIVTSYDWDSLHAEYEPVMVGAAAHAFTTDWQRENIARVPSIEEMRAFVADYEAARGRAFDRGERATLSASLVYSIAYTARCAHAGNPREGGSNGDFRPLLRKHGPELLERGL